MFIHDLKMHFYPRSPCGERPDLGFHKTESHRFLSTLSLRRATCLPCGCWSCDTDFYPRSPCGERRQPSEPHSVPWQFLSTLSLRRATPVMGSLTLYGQYFYPRSPCGERQARLAALSGHRAFLSTLSLRRATDVWMSPRRSAPISIHALLAESDHSLTWTTTQEGNFYPRSPCGERQ